MKGVLKGFKYISNIFDEEEEDDEIQIGLPTDVKHVAHIGMDGPSTESPSWMKDFSAERPKSAPLDSKGAPLDSSGDKTSTDTELTRTSRRRHSADSLAFDTTGALVAKTKGRKHHKKHSDGSAGKSSRARRHHRKNSSDQEGSSRSSHISEDNNSEPTSPTSPTSGKLPDIPKKSRRKKVKDEISKLATKAKPKASGDHGADVPPLPSPAPLPPPSPAPLPPPSPSPSPIPPAATTDNTSRPSSDGSAATESKPTITCDGESCQITLKPSPPNAEDKKTDKSDVVGVP